MVKKNKYETLYEYPNIPYWEGKTMRYLLPTLGMRSNRLLAIKTIISGRDVLRALGLKGVYYQWLECPDNWNNEVYMLFCPSKDVIYTIFSQLYDYLRELPNFVKLYHINNGVIIIVMKIDQKWEGAKSIIKSGKYSNLGKVYANNFFNNNGILGREFHIICKTEEYRRKMEIELGLEENYLLGDELDEMFDIEKETLNLQKLKIEYRNDGNR